MDWGAGRLALLCLLLGVWAPAVRGKIAADQHWGPVATCLLIFSSSYEMLEFDTCGRLESKLLCYNCNLEDMM